MASKKVLFVLFSTLAIAIGLYPLFMLFMGLHFDLFNSKSTALLADALWNISFYTHISLGGIALLIGWTGFSKKLRTKNIEIHRNIGKAYIAAVLLSAIGGIYIGFFATGGIITSTGFISLGIIWFFTTWKAYQFAKAKNIIAHRKMMIYSYAACFAAVTLRLWMPLLLIIFNDFDIAYKIVAWLCWVPNLYVAHLIISKQKSNSPIKDRVSLSSIKKF
ncbi:MAG: putative membrane protein [Saprospiraceae bacterium]|jgi:uncharacterized membrane protein